MLPIQKLRLLIKCIFKAAIIHLLLLFTSEFNICRLLSLSNQLSEIEKELDQL